MAELIAFLNALPVLWKIYVQAKESMGTDWVEKTQALIDAYAKAKDAKNGKALEDAARSVHDAWTK